MYFLVVGPVCTSPVLATLPRLWSLLQSLIHPLLPSGDIISIENPYLVGNGTTDNGRLVSPWIAKNVHPRGEMICTWPPLARGTWLIRVCFRCFGWMKRCSRTVCMGATD